MAEGGGSRTKSKSSKMKMTVEEYLNFVYSDTKPDLTVDHLNQVIDMHGFKRIPRQKKSVLIEALNSMGLMDLTRSTVNVNGVSADAVLSIDAVISDLKELKWEECCVTSLQTINRVVHQPSPLPTDSSSAMADESTVKYKRKRKSKKLNDAIIQDNCASVSGGGTDFGESGTASLNWLPPKKRGMEPSSM